MNLIMTQYWTTLIVSEYEPKKCTEMHVARAPRLVSWLLSDSKQGFTVGFTDNGRGYGATGQS